MRYRSIAVPAALGLTSLLPAQQDVVKDVQAEAQFSDVTAVAGSLVGVAPQTATFQFVASEPGLFGKVVSGAPYSGEGFTEIVQTLADGTRIANNHSKKVWRDRQGRTREESTFTMLGPWAAESGASHKLITITDPIAKTVYMLNEQDKTATRRKMHDLAGMMTKFEADAKAGGKTSGLKARERQEIVIREGAWARVDNLMVAPPPPAATGVAFARAVRIGGDGGKEESLGTQVLEGLKVEGKRQTFTVKAGEIGNDRELVSLTERWNSIALQVLVRMTTKDPQMGETTYRLTNISRAEPAAALFQVPADYTVTEANEQFRFERKIETKR